MEHFKQLPIEIFFVLLAIVGGVARYLNSFANGEPFKLSILCASALVAGFSGYMFALMGKTMQFPDTFLFMMAGIGGFFGEQTMKFIMEYVERKIK